MEAIEFITGWVKWVIILIPFGAGAMVTYQAIRKSLSDDEGTISDATSKIKKTILGAIIAMSMGTTIEVVKGFYLVNGAPEKVTYSKPVEIHRNYFAEFLKNFKLDKK